MKQIATFCLGSTVLLACLSAAGAEKDFMQQLMNQREDLPHCRAITTGPKYHWFGYYDKLQFDPSCRYVLSMAVDFEHRSPKPDDVVTVGMVDLENDNAWTALGKTTAWCWQQGCMLQWRPGSNTEVMWNDREDGKYVCRILDIATKKLRTLPRAVYHASPDGKWGLSLDFRRLQDMRPGYGYPGIPDPNAEKLTPDDTGLWRVDLETGAVTFLFTVATIADFPKAGIGGKDAKHYVNHIEWDTVGRRFVFLNRWRKSGGRFITRMLSASLDGTDLRIVSDNPGVSHFVWRDAEHVSIWHGGGFYLYPDDGSRKPTLQWKAPNGHQTYVPGTDNKWMVSDTYPRGKKREQIPYLYHLPTGRVRVLGYFPLPKKYRGQWRCDTHPRTSPDGRRVCIDSPHGGNGRQLYLIDIAGLTDGGTAGIQQ